MRGQRCQSRKQSYLTHKGYPSLQLPPPMHAAASDLFQVAPPDAASRTGASPSGARSVFFCGNFGAVLFNLLAQQECYEVLRKMAEVRWSGAASSATTPSSCPRADEHPVACVPARVPAMPLMPAASRRLPAGRPTAGRAQGAA